MFKSQLEPSAENFVETQIFVENIFDTVKKAREAKAARSLAESKLAHYDYSFDFSPSKRKKTRKNAKSKTPKNGKTKTTPKKKPRKPRTPKDSAEKKKKPPTTPKTPRKYTKRAKLVKPQNDIDDEEAAFILSSISQRSFDSFYNRFNGTTPVENKIHIPLETSTIVQSPPAQPTTPPKKSEPSHLTAYHHVLLDHNYWIVEPPAPTPVQAPTTPTSTVVVTNDGIDKSNNESHGSMNLLLTVASHELSSQCTQNSTNSSIKVEVNNNKLPLLDVNCDTPKLSSTTATTTTPMSDDNAVKKRWLRQATTECSTPSPTVTPPETSPNDIKAPLKKRRVVREIDDNNEIKIGVSSETESSKIDQTVCFESNNFKNNVEAIKFNNNNNNNFVNNSALLKLEPVESVNINLREIHEKIEMEFGRQPKIEQNVVVVKEEPRSVIQSPIGHQMHGVKNNLTFGIQMNSPVDVNAIYGRSQPENLIKIDQQRTMIGHEGKLPHTQIYDEKLIKLEPHERPAHDYRPNNVNIVEVKLPQVYGLKTEAVKPEIYEQKQIKLESPISEKVITVDGKLQQILDRKIQKIYRDNSQYFMDQHVEQKVQNYGQFYNKVAEPPHQTSVIQNLEDISYRNQMENIQKQNHIIIHTGSQKLTENFNIYGDEYPKIHQLSPTKLNNQLKGLSSPTKIQISPTRTYEIYTKNPHENIAESLLKLQQESPVKLLQMSPTKVIHSPNYQVAQALTFETSTDHGYQKKVEELTAKKLKKTQKVAKIKAKAPKVKKTPTKAKKAQQKPKKIKTPKSPSKIGKNKKNSVKIDKNLIKNFGNLEDVPLKIRQNLAFEEKIMMKMKDNEVRAHRVSESDAKIHPIVGLIPPFDTKFQQIGGKIMQVDGKLSQVDLNLSQVDTRMGQADGKLGQVDAKLGQFDETINKVDRKMNDIDGRINHLKVKSSQLDDQVDSQVRQADSQVRQAEISFAKNLTNSHKFDGHSQLNDTKLTQLVPEIHKNDIKSLQNHQNDIKLQESINKVHKFDNLNSKIHEISKLDQQHVNNKRTISESSSGSSKTSSCSSKSSKNSTETQKFQSKKALKKLKFDDSEECQKSDDCEAKLRNLMEDSKEISSNDQHLAKQASIIHQNSSTFTNFQVIKDNYAEKLNRRTISESSSVSSRTLSCNSPDNTPGSSFVHLEGLSGAHGVTVIGSEGVKTVNLVGKANLDTKLHESSTGASSILKTSQISPVKLSDDSKPATLHLNNRKLSSGALKASVEPMDSLPMDTVDGCSSSEGNTASKAEDTPIIEVAKPKLSLVSIKSELPPTTASNEASVASNALTEIAGLESKPLGASKLSTDLTKLIPTVNVSSENVQADKPTPDEPTNEPATQVTPNSNESSSSHASTAPLPQTINSTTPNLDDDIIKTIIEPPSILKSLSDGIAPIKPIIDSLIPFKSTIESLESIIDTTKSNLDSDLKPEKVVEQQVASILEKVIPKTLKTDFVKELEVEIPPNEPETEPIESDNDMDDEDDTPYRESVEEFHKDTLEKLMEANKRFCRENYVHNPFKHSVSYDGRDSGRYSKTDDYHTRNNRGYDYDDHRKPLKMSLSFESHQQYSSHHNYPQHYQRSISEVFNDPRKERWCGNGMYENRNYGSFHYDKIHHREPITTTYSMYRAQKASQMESRWSNRPNYEYQQEPQHKVNNYVPEKPPMAPQTQPQQPITPTVINSYRPIQPEPIRVEPPVLAVSPQAEALKIATSEPFVGFLMDTKLSATSPAAVLPKTKTASHDPRLNPSLVQDVKKEEPATPKKKLSLDQYRKRKSLTNVAQISPTDEILPSLSVSITESPSPTLSPAFDPSIAAAAATG